MPNEIREPFRRVKTQLEVETRSSSWKSNSSRWQWIAGAAAPRGIIENLVTNIWVMCESAQKQQVFLAWQAACLPTEQRKFNIQGGRVFKAGNPQRNYDDLAVTPFLLHQLKKKKKIRFSKGFLKPLEQKRRQARSIFCWRVRGVAEPGGAAAARIGIAAASQPQRCWQPWPRSWLPSLPSSQQLPPPPMLEKMFSTAEQLGPAAATQRLEIILWNGEGRGAGNWALKISVTKHNKNV